MPVLEVDIAPAPAPAPAPDSHNHVHVDAATSAAIAQEAEAALNQAEQGAGGTLAPGSNVVDAGSPAPVPQSDDAAAPVDMIPAFIG